MRDGNTQRQREAALSEVIGFVLLLGVLVAAMALWMMYVVPVTGREDEITQMNSVKDRFTDYKITLDSLWINSNNPSVPTLSGVTVSTSFNLGTGGGNTQAGGLFLPMMKPIASSAVLSLNNTGGWMNISSMGDSPLGPAVIQNCTPIQRLEYQSRNNYWIQQKYYYETGGVFLEQENGATTRVAPPLSITNASADATSWQAFNASVVVAPISLDGGATIGGSGPVRVDSRLKSIHRAFGPVKQYWVNISVIVPDYRSAQLWNATFLEAMNNGAVPDNANWYITGTSAPSVTPATAYAYVRGPYDDTTHPDVWLTIHPVEFAVTFNNIASGIT